MLAGFTSDCEVWRAGVSALSLSSVDHLLRVHFVLSQCLEVVGLHFSMPQLLLHRSEYRS